MTALSALLLAAATAAAAPSCPMELATYADRDGAAEIEFRPTLESVTVTNTFRMLLENDVVLDGIVMWTQDDPRPYGALKYKCPEGDVTGEEIEACTVWQGVVYAVDEAGAVAALPAEKTVAPRTLVFPDLGPSLRHSAAGRDFSKLPWDVFSMKGCHE